MSNQQLRQLLWRHYRTLFLTATVILAVAGLKEGLSNANQPNMYIAAGAFTLQYSSGLRLLVAMAVFFVLGLAVFLNDNWTNFNHYLFSLPVTRRRIYRQKMLLLSSTLISSYLLMEIIYSLLVQRVLAKRHAYFDWNTIWKEELVQIAIFLVLMMITVTFGLWVGHILASALAAFVFTCSLIFAYDGVTNLLSGMLGVSYRQVAWLDHLNWDHWRGMLLTLVICVVLIGLLYWLNRWAFEHLSLENSREFFRFPQLRGAVLWFSIIYLMIATSCSQFGLELLGLITDNYRSTMPVPAGIVMAVVIGYITWSLGRWFLYRPDRFWDAWTIKKLD